MTMNTTDRIRIRHIPLKHFVNRILMAFHTVALKNPVILSLNHDWLMKILHRKALGVVPAVFGLGEVLSNEVVRKMTIDTPGNVMMAGFLPGVILRIHNMTVRTGSWIRAEVGQPFGVAEGKRSGAYQQTQHGGQN